MLNFNRYIGIDWTGAKSPVISKAISVAECTPNNTAPALIAGPWSRARVGAYISSLLPRHDRVLIGIDCNFGYAAEIIQKQFGERATAHDLWDKVENLNSNHPNFFAGAFWTHPDYAPYFWTEGKMKEGFAMPRRLTETICGESGYGWPESPFKMIGAKQVGKGGLAGMRLACHLKQQHGNAVCVWPFDPPEIWDTASVVITEIYPRQFIKRAGHGNKKLRTINDLNNALDNLNSSPIADRAVSDHDTDALIAAAGLRYLCGNGINLPQDLACPAASRLTLTREGWIFGAGYTP